MEEKPDVKMDDLVKKNEELSKQLAAMTGDRNAWHTKHDDLLAKHQALVEEHNAMLAALPPAVLKNLKKKPEYVYGKDECHPVPRGGTCEKCGWSADPMNPKHGEPHAVL